MVLTDIDKPACAGQLGPEFADIQVPGFVTLGQPQKSDVKAAAVIEIKLGGLVNDCVSIDRCSENPSGRSLLYHFKTKFLKKSCEF